MRPSTNQTRFGLVNTIHESNLISHIELFLLSFVSFLSCRSGICDVPGVTFFYCRITPITQVIEYSQTSLIRASLIRMPLNPNTLMQTSSCNDFTIRTHFNGYQVR